MRNYYLYQKTGSFYSNGWFEVMALPVDLRALRSSSLFPAFSISQTSYPVQVLLFLSEPAQMDLSPVFSPDFIHQKEAADFIVLVGN